METTTTMNLHVLDEIIKYFDGDHFELAGLIEEALFIDYYEVEPLKEESSAGDFEEALEMYYDSNNSIYDQRVHLRAVIRFTSEKDLIPIMVSLLNCENKGEAILAIRKMAEILLANSN